MTPVAVDSNLLRYPTTRRLLHGIALETDTPLYILPEVHRELIDRAGLVRSELGRLKRRMAKQGRAADESVFRPAIRDAVATWYEDLQSSVFTRIEDDQTVDYWQSMAEQIPAEIFKVDLQRERTDGDPIIVAQAIHYGIPLLSSNNLKTIDHAQCNEWIRHKGFNGPAVSTPSETIALLSNRDTEVAYHWLLTHATNQVFENEPENRREFARALAVINDGGFKETDAQKPVGSDAFKTIAFRVRQLFESDDRFMSRLHSAVQSPHRETAIQTELDLNQAVNLAVDHARRTRL